MIFNEIYGCYYNAVAEILKLAVKNELTEKAIREIVRKKAFSESFLTVVPAMKNEKWQLLHKDLSTPLQHEPTLPLTELQKRWLKAVSLDKRVKLFGLDFGFLDGVTPLFTPDDFFVFDRYLDGDDYENESYIKNFRTILAAIKNRRKLSIRYHGSKGSDRVFKCDPYRLEYSEKDDRFRVLIRSCRFATMLRLDGIEKCEDIGEAFPGNDREVLKNDQYLVVSLTNERNTLERVMLHFSHFKKEAEKLDNGKYRLKIYYDSSDETELVIRVLSFGPFVEVTEPLRFRSLITERLENQKKLNI